jgi:hypothetical protein
MLLKTISLSIVKKLLKKIRSACIRFKQISINLLAHLLKSCITTLTDKYWLHGKATRMDIVKVIRDGVPEKGMPPWGPVMKKDEIYAVSAFILSKKGSNPAGAKEPQGEAVE